MKYDENDPLIISTIEDMILDPAKVENLIKYIYDDIYKAGVKEMTVFYPESYFIMGQCNIYAKILSDIFGKYATTYDNTKHVITKIGDNFYDFNGLYKISEEDGKFIELPKDWLLASEVTGLGAYHQMDDDPLIEAGVNAGRRYIYEKAYQLSNEKSSR